MEMTDEAREKLLEYIQSPECPTYMMPVYHWWLRRRPEQRCPEPVPTIWLLMAGRGAGKTWAAANHIYEYCCELPWVPENEKVFVALIGAVFDDVKHTMVEGKSGLLNVVPEENLIAWNRTVGELKFFIRDGKNYREVNCLTYTSERPEKLRGPNTHVAWIDEMAKFKDADIDPTTAGTTFNNMMLGLRLGTKPHVIVTGTPTPCRLVRYLLTHENMKLSSMTTLDNKENLPQSFLDELMRLRPESRTYRQEVLGQVLLDNPDAIFSQNVIDENRASPPSEEELARDKVPFIKVLGYDPSASAAEDADECGIMLCGYTPEVKIATNRLGGRPVVVKPVHGYVLKDLSGHYTPSEQVQIVIKTVLKEKVTDLLFEQNQGVDFVMSALEQAIKDNTIQYKLRQDKRAKKTDYGIVKAWRVSGVDLKEQPFKFVIYAIHAVQGKKLRAEMVSTRYDSDQIHHPEYMPTCQIKTCQGNLEVQMTSWDPESKNSPDRLDAMVYCMLHIFSGNMLTRSKVTIARPDVTQATSQHEAAKKLRGKAGIYSIDVISDGSEKADRSLIHFMDRDNGLIESVIDYTPYERQI